MNRIAKAILLSTLPLCSLAQGVDWYPETTENRPFVRWWWLGSAVDPEGLTFNLSEFADKGLGGVEITPIYGVKGNEANDIPYLSDRWMEMLGHTTAESQRLGLQVDMNNGTGWPFGGPTVTTDQSARKQIVTRYTVQPGETQTIKLEPNDKKQAGVATLQRLIAVNGTDRRDITSSVKDGSVTFTVPSGKDPWTLYALWVGRTMQKVKRAAPGGEGLVVNHLDSVAVKDYLSRFDKAFEGREAMIPHTFFNDSYEVYGADWTEGLLDEFERENGYKLEMYLPEFVGDTEDVELRGRVLGDYRRTLGHMLQKHFTEVWTAWAHSKGAKIRNQSHGSPANILDLYAAVDIPECESFGKSDFNIPNLPESGPSRPSDADPAVLKFASSAAHVAGKPLTSAETLTWLTEHFHTSLARCKPEIDQMLASGVNHIYFHGAPYSPHGVEFPGWKFYASIDMSPTNSMWADSRGLMDYITRCQAFLTAGRPDNDFLLFFPYDDLVHRYADKPYMMFEIHKMNTRMPEVKQAVGDIINAGFDVDYVSDSLLTCLDVTRDGTVLSRGGNDYKAIIVPKIKYMQPQTLARLERLAREGATVAFVGGVPEDVPGLGHLEERRAQLKAVAEKLPKGPGFKDIQYGHGRIVVAVSVENALNIIGLQPEEGRKLGLSMIRRANEMGGHNYFIANLTDQPIDRLLPLAKGSVSAMIFDPLTGERGKAYTRRGAVQISLDPGQSLLVKTFPGDVKYPDWKYVRRSGNELILNGKWEVSFPKSDPPIEKTFKTRGPVDWTTLKDPRAQINTGTAHYKTTFILPQPTEIGEALPDGWILDLGQVRESARVYVNGHYVGTVWSVPYRIDIAPYIKKGKNTIELEITNLQANRIRDYEKRGVEWRRFKDANIASVTGAKTFSFGDWPVTPSGLTRPVTLTPIYY